MKSKVKLFLLFFLVSSSIFAQKNLYPDTDLPGFEPQIFGENILSTGLNEITIAIAPDYKEIYFTIRHKSDFFKIYYVSKTNYGWSAPQAAPFSSKFKDADPFITKDGQKLFFCSDRLTDKNDKKRDWNIWFVTKNGDKWSEPELVPFDNEKNEMFPTLSDSGNMVFHADYGSERKTLDITHTDIYYSKFDGTKFLKPEKLESSISSPSAEWDPFIAPDESYIMFTSTRKKNMGGGDLFISYKDETGNWGKVKNMGYFINSRRIDYCPALSPDRKYLLFSSSRMGKKKILASEKPGYFELAKTLGGMQNGLSDIYWMDASIIKNLKNNIWWEDTGREFKHDLSDKKILMIVGENFDFHEADLIPRELEKMGADVVTAAVSEKLTGHIINIDGLKFDKSEKREIEADILISEIELDDYDAIYFPGGGGPANIIKNPATNSLVRDLIKKAVSENKLVAAICHGPLIFADAGIIKGKKVTCNRAIIKEIKSAGGNFQNVKCISDGNMLTGNWPFFETFTAEFAKMLEK
ncbi:MAG: DJ-1/PfpI family protein [Rhodothermaceae bacterium]